MQNPIPRKENNKIMKTTYLKFKDPVFHGIGAGFVKPERAFRNPPVELEIAGFIVNETDDLLTLSVAKADDTFIDKIEIPKKGIIERGKTPKDVRTLKYYDIKFTKGNIPIKSMEGKLLEVEVCGFYMGETDEAVYIASERKRDEYRVVTTIPKGLIL